MHQKGVHSALLCLQFERIAVIQPGTFLYAEPAAQSYLLRQWLCRKKLGHIMKKLSIIVIKYKLCNRNHKIGKLFTFRFLTAILWPSHEGRVKNKTNYVEKGTYHERVQRMHRRWRQHLHPGFSEVLRPAPGGVPSEEAGALRH